MALTLFLGKCKGRLFLSRKNSQSIIDDCGARLNPFELFQEIMKLGGLRNGVLAQVVEPILCMQEEAGSMLAFSIQVHFDLAKLVSFCINVDKKRIGMKGEDYTSLSKS